MAWHVFRILDNIAFVLLLIAVLAYVAHLDRDEQRFAAITTSEFDPGVPAYQVPDQVVTLAAPLTPPAGTPSPPEDPVLQAQRLQYDAVAPKTVIELQQFRRAQTVAAEGWGGRKGRATLVNLNPRINAWFLLTLDWGGNKVQAKFHLENPDSRRQSVQLSETGGGSLLLSRDGTTYVCDLWAGEKSAIDQARSSGAAYASLCGGRLYLRNQVQGHYTDLEQMTEFLRDNVWNGDEIVGFVKQTVYQDAYKETGKTSSTDGSEGGSDEIPPALVAPDAAKTSVVPDTFGISVEGAPGRRMQLGHWYPVHNSPGIFASVMRPGSVSPEVLARDKPHVNPLDSVEASALSYLVAFDLGLHEMRFGLGTDHPRLNWSARVIPEVRNGALAGPDGFATAAPLVTNGMVGPAGFGRIVGAFSGGFKREHGAFKWGDLARINGGSHYGFVENGVVLSKLQPGISTLYSLDDGTFGMKTWTTEDNRFLSRIAFARQNGVPLVEPGTDGRAIAGSMVNRWGPGNWSGSADAKLRTVRGGACLLSSGGKRYLVYGYFSTATPSALALVFHSYGCQYAVNLDMNALEHTYLAVYSRNANKLEVQHLVRGMAGIDKSVSGNLIPRFVGYPDNRDFFYMVRRNTSP